MCSELFYDNIQEHIIKIMRGELSNVLYENQDDYLDDIYIDLD